MRPTAEGAERCRAAVRPSRSWFADGRGCVPRRPRPSKNRWRRPVAAPRSGGPGPGPVPPAVRRGSDHWPPAVRWTRPPACARPARRRPCAARSRRPCRGSSPGTHRRSPVPGPAVPASGVSGRSWPAREPCGARVPGAHRAHWRSPWLRSSLRVSGRLHRGCVRRSAPGYPAAARTPHGSRRQWLPGPAHSRCRWRRPRRRLAAPRAPRPASARSPLHWQGGPVRPW